MTLELEETLSLKACQLRRKNTIISSGRVRIKYQDYVATGPKAAFFPDKKTGKPNEIVFFGRSMIQQDNKIIEADRIKLNVNPKNFDAEGNVRTKFSKVNVMDSTTKK